jgi:hypothetical protein
VVGLCIDPRCGLGFTSWRENGGRNRDFFRKGENTPRAECEREGGGYILTDRKSRIAWKAYLGKLAAMQITFMTQIAPTGQ